ncbi:MAG: Clp protease ClpP [Oscillospiraceae bacterium]|nr:Clp protease ClpP [Oscillospiraceae bacterium]
MSKFFDIKMSANTPKTVEIYIYTDIEADSKKWFSGEKIKSETSAETFRETLAAVGEFDNINIYINSLGGSVKEAVAIHNQLKRHKAHKTAFIDGFCCSAATLIALAADEIIMPKNAVFMIHEAWVFAAGNARALRKTANDLDVVNGAAREIYLARKTEALSSAALIDMMAQETYLSAEDCIKYGFADKYADYEVDFEKAKAQLKKEKADAQNSMLGNGFAAQEFAAHCAAFADKICAAVEKIETSAIQDHPVFKCEANLKTYPIQGGECEKPHIQSANTIAAMMTAFNAVYQPPRL